MVYKRGEMAKKAVRALVKPDILAWARESAGYTLEEVAASSGLSKVREWEAGELRPTINQLRALARKYRRPLAVFYLHERPDDFKPISDFRRPPGIGMIRMSPRLRLEIRDAQERRQIALDLLEETGEDLPPFSISATLRDDPETVGGKMRSYLRISEDRQMSWSDHRKAFNGWRELIEEAGVLVFQMEKIDTSEASGFALSDSKLPAIAVNRADTPARRTFSLLHELAHLLLAQSGVSGFDIDLTRPPENQKVEVWCNAVAAAALLPRRMLLAADVVRSHDGGNPVWEDRDIAALASAFGVSRVLIVRRLLTLSLTNEPFYRNKESEYAAGYAALLEDRRTSLRDNEFGGRNMPQEAFSLLGRNFIRLILMSYHNDQITLSDVSSYLNLKTKHVPHVEKTLLRRLA